MCTFHSLKGKEMTDYNLQMSIRKETSAVHELQIFLTILLNYLLKFKATVARDFYTSHFIFSINLVKASVSIYI
jgi:hypothetical protein